MDEDAPTGARISCTACGERLAPEADACGSCGSPDRTIHLFDSATLTEELRLKGRHAEAGTPKRPYLEVQDGPRWNHDRQRHERRRIVADRDRDYYEQVWTDPATGEETFAKRGRLSDPDMHGESARRGKGTQP